MPCRSSIAEEQGKMQQTHPMEDRQADMNAYCLQCETGQEARVVDILDMTYHGLTALCARQEKHKSRQGVKRLVQVNMLPGYVFLYATGEIPVRSILGHHSIFRFLSYGSAGDYALRGGDKDFADWIYRNNGLLSCSQAVQVGTEVRILSGPLTDSIGTIEKIDRHNRNVCLSIPFDGIRRLVWMPFEWTDQAAAPFSIT